MRYEAVPRATHIPRAPRVDVVEELGPYRVADPYRWLEDAGDSMTVSWLDEQQALLRDHRGRWRAAAGFLRRMEQLTAFDECSPPVWRGSRAFFTCRGPDDQHPSLRVRDHAPDGSPSGPERVLLDPMLLDSSGHTTLDDWTPSPDGRLISCQLSADGTEQAVMRILDTGSGSFTDAPIGGCRFSSVAWLPDGDAFYYVADAADAAGRRVWLHSLGGGAGQDRVVFGAGLDGVTDLDIVLDRAGERLVVTAVTDLAGATEIWLVEQPAAGDAADCYRIAACQGGWTCAWPGDDGLLYLLTDDGAPRGRIVVADIRAARSDPGRTLVPEYPAAVLESFVILSDDRLADPVILLSLSESGRARLSCHDLRTGRWLRDVPLPGAGTVTDLTCRQHSGHEAWFSYTDTLTPPTVHQYDAWTGSVGRWRDGPQTGPRGVVARELRYRSADGTPVRLLLTLPADVSEPRPTILHAYGAFGEPAASGYYELGLAWAEAGGILAVPCVRGGGDEGEAWHRAGMLGNKQRGIDDLLAAADYLIAVGLADRDRIGVKGFSAGGLLAAAAMIQRPGLFTAVECTSPLLDMTRYELSGLGSRWSGEFGSRDDPTELGWLLGYSPYHNVTDGTRYPAVLLITFDGDTRVDPMHARKMCAALQHATTSELPVLLRTEAGVGHGERSRSARLRYFADILAFFANYLTGLTYDQTGAANGSRKEVDLGD